MTPPRKIIEFFRLLCGIHKWRGVTLPTVSFLADGSLFIFKLVADDVRPYRETEAYLQGSKAMLHKGRCVTIPVRSPDTLPLPDTLRILPAEQAIVMLGISIGQKLFCELAAQNVINQMIDRCH